jgi:hypothetical protein
VDDPLLEFYKIYLKPRQLTLVVFLLQLAVAGGGACAFTLRMLVFLVIAPSPSVFISDLPLGRRGRCGAYAERSSVPR